MAILVFIESNTTGTGELLLEASLRRGLQPYFLTADRDRYPFLDRHPVVTVAIDTADVAAVTEFVASLEDVAGVFSSSELFIEVASETAARLGLATANSEAIRTCRDKKRLAEVLSARGVGAPHSIDLPLWDIPRGSLEDLPYPMVVKPRTGTGSVNVRLTANADEVLSHCERMRKDGLMSALVQEYVQGDEYSVETITVEGRTWVMAVVRKHLGPEPDFVEIGHSCPAPLAAAERQRIEDTVVRALEAVDFRFGPAHTELRVHGDKVTIIEINPRLAGGLIPLLLERVCEVDVLDHVLALWCGERTVPDFTARRYGAIRFALATTPGRLERPVALSAEAARLPELRLFRPLKEPGALLTLSGDFRDRVAAVICAGDQRDAVEAAALRAASQVLIAVAPLADESGATRAPGLPPALQAVVYHDAEAASLLQVEIEHLLDINEAHLLMLAQCGFVDHEKVRRLLAEHQALRADEFATLRALPRPRGLYMALERHLVERLGEEVGGVLQTGRSRNDINATIAKLMLRSAVGRVLANVWTLRNSLVYKASTETDQAFPIYSQYQAALPGTLTHELLAFEQALACESRVLIDSLDEIDVCPLGAGAGGGTTLPIDSALTCKLLGFDRPAVNSLDAVANRSAVVHFLSSMNALGLLLSRIAQDLQLWTMSDRAFVAFPDELVGGSSMLPQKRNPFLIEFMKSRATVPLGVLASCSAAIGKTPYTNSFEVSAQLHRFVAESERAVQDVLVVGRALVDGLEVVADQVDAHLKATGVASMAVSEALVLREGLSFRSAHTQVTRSMRSALEAGRSCHEALLEVDEGLMSRRPLEWAASHRHGGGPGSAGLDSVVLACRQLAHDGIALRQRRQTWGEARRMRELACQQIING